MSAQTTDDTVCDGVSRYALAHISDDELLTGTRRLVGCSNQLFADLLAHLAEVEALAAEGDFGRESIDRKRNGHAHEPARNQRAP